MHTTHTPPSAAPDLVVIRESALRVLDLRTTPPHPTVLDLISEVRGHLRVVAKAVRELDLESDSNTRRVARSMLAEAACRLSVPPGSGRGTILDHAKGLADVTLSLADVYHVARDQV